MSGSNIISTGILLWHNFACCLMLRVFKDDVLVRVDETDRHLAEDLRGERACLPEA